jgi:ABC-type amino acid transport substrate-binding protein
VKPSSRQIIESIQWELDTRVAPEVQSDWARSSLRSINSLLAHLAARVELEVDLLMADNADIRSLLADLGAGEALTPDEAGWRGFAALVEENEGLRDQVDQVLRTLLADGPPDALAKVTSYLDRQLARERPLVDPAFKGAIF